jgi:hypothetical protein
MGSQVQDILQMPFFSMKVDNSVEYHCLSQNSLGDQVNRMNSNEFAVYN